MQLSKLEIKGFKSFGDKVTVNFDEGITGIVGPNGCGKSNIVDAIRWVLGEQKTKALRSEKMENIIFNGTKNRKALQMAEVSLTFNNTRNLLPTEYSHITVTRKYYRTGESEYLLNNVTCRLKDITNLFLDTGIGSDSYAIIELKMVDEILNDKDNSRRGLFEEAAGISKFKVRKKETIRKLEDTDNDLARVEDLVHEISKNLKVLEKQAKQTQSYFRLKEEYKHWSIALARKMVQTQSDTYNNLGKSINREQERRLVLQGQLSDRETALENEKAGLIQKEKLFASRQKSLIEHSNQIRQYESEKKIKYERLAFLTDKATSLREQISQDQASIDQSSGVIKRLQQDKGIAERVLQELTTSVEVLKEEYDYQKELTSDLQHEASQVNQTYRTRQDEVYQLKKTLEIKQMQLSSLKQELEKATSDSAERTASLQQFDDKLYELSEQLEEKNAQLATLQQSLTNTQQRLGQLETELDNIRQEQAQITRTLDAKKNEYNLIKSLVDNLEGFPEAIKFLKKHHAFDKYSPLLSDILTCPDAYRIAIENYLEPVMNYYVVQNEEQAYEAIQILSNANKGRAHFFVLNQVPSYKMQSSTLANAEKGIIPALSIVEYDTKYQNLIGHLLDGVYILAQDHEALLNGAQAIFLTQNGKVAKRRFSVSGGSVGSFEGKRIGRAKNLENLEAEIGQLTKSLAAITEKQRINLQQKSETASKAAELTTRIGLKQREINLLSQEHISVKTKREQMALMLSNQATRQEDMLDKIEVLQEEIDDQKPEAEAKAAELKTLESRINRLNSELITQNEALGLKSSYYNQENIRLHQQQNKVTAIIQQISFHQGALEKNQLRIDKSQDELDKAEESITELTGSTQLNDSQLTALYQEKELVEKAVDEAEKSYYQARGTIDKLEKEGREIQRQRESADALLAELRHKLNETKLQLTAIKERLAVEFNLDLDDFIQEKSADQPLSPIASEAENMSESVLRERVQDLKNRMDKIGPINPMALEAYEEMKSRHDFIVAQKKDLVQAKQSLMDTISQIDTVAKENFMKAYEQIRENFIKVFRSLFSEEDTCDLKLSNPDNPLESSIEIMAKPKGKRPLTINQLSGGEKTLTATSLLFAIYLLKPAPFCIFDEVDAPLDDANIDKFNNIIKKFSGDSQFIIVTHNKRTMATTDIIYGITMIEPGVSRVVPVDLRSLN